MNNYASVSGQSLYSANLDAIHDASFVISVGSAVKSDNPNVRYAINNSMVVNKGAALYFHPVNDVVVSGMGKNLLAIEHKPLLEEAVLYLILDLFADKKSLPQNVVDYLASFHSTKTETITETVKEKVEETVKVMKVNEETGEEEEVEEVQTKTVSKKVEKEIEVDVNALYDIVGLPKKFDETLEKLLKKKDTFSMIVGPDMYNHPNAANIAKLCALIEKHSKFSLLMIPELTNSLGVAQICTLSDGVDGYAIGYNCEADFKLSALGDGDLDMPALNQQEGTLTSIDKRVSPTNAAVDYNGYVLK